MDRESAISITARVHSTTPDSPFTGCSTMSMRREARGTPYPGVGRNTLRGNTVNELDASVFKTVRINERFSGQLRMNVYNLPNRAYYGTPDLTLNNANPSGHTHRFRQVTSPSSPSDRILEPVGYTVPFGKGTRNIQSGAKMHLLDPVCSPTTPKHRPTSRPSGHDGGVAEINGGPGLNRNLKIGCPISRF